MIDKIRAISRPGRDDRVDDRPVGRHQAAVDELHTTYQAFVAAARADLGVPA